MPNSAASSAGIQLHLRGQGAVDADVAEIEMRILRTPARLRRLEHQLQHFEIRLVSAEPNSSQPTWRRRARAAERIGLGAQHGAQIAQTHDVLIGIAARARCAPPAASCPNANPAGGRWRGQ